MRFGLLVISLLCRFYVRVHLSKWFTACSGSSAGGKNMPIFCQFLPFGQVLLVAAFLQVNNSIVGAVNYFCHFIKIQCFNSVSGHVIIRISHK